jgi:archaellum biogenesis ATPase FlaH
VIDFLTWKECFKKEAECRLDTDIKKLCSYGIKPLDDALICINKGELVVIGADSGVGKTEIAVQIASHNAKLGKKVALYHLEGGYREAIARMKWRDISQEYYLNHRGQNIEMNYQKWVVNLDQPKLLMEIEAKVWKEYEEKYGNNLFLYHSKKDLTLTDFLASLLDFHSLATAFGSLTKEGARGAGFDLDLIVIDHLQYFSLDQSESEITEITNIIRQVKKVTDDYQIPVVLISHLRKKSKDRGLPDQQDFYGSSNIPKIANTAITITPQINKEDFFSNIYPTWIRVVKSRVGVKPSMAILSDFDGRKKSYSDRYLIHKVNGDGHTSPEPMTESELPKWAKGNSKRDEVKSWHDKL